jgi:hypothetical protein
MLFKQPFDIYDRPEKPYVILCNPNKNQLYSLDNITDTNLKIRLNALSEFSFSIPEYVDGQLVESYAHIVSKKLVLIENIGYFIIENPEEILEGFVNKKHVTCKSLEAELNYKKITSFSGTYAFFNPVTPTGTLLDKIIKMIPGWSIGEIDSALYTKSRTFKVADSTIYAFLMNDVETAYECIFSFDTFNKKINAYSRTTVTKDTDIYLSFDNLIKNAALKTISEEIVTCLHVYGAGDLDILTVNPLGSTAIYDFSYFKSTDWMSQSLLNAINAWELKVTNAQTTYANLLTLVKTQNEKLLDLINNTTNGLVKLQSQYDTLVGVQKVRIEAGLSYADITAQMTAKLAEINTKKAEITAQENLIKATQTSLTTLNGTLKFETNFSPSLLIELQSFIIENTYQNQNFLQTSIMTQKEIQDTAQDLYNQGKEVLARVAVPRYEFEVDSANFLWLKEYLPFTEQVDLGSVVTIDLDKYTIKSVLLEIDMSYEDPAQFKLTFSNRLRLDNGEFRYSDLFGDLVKTGATVGFESEKWSDWYENSKGDVADFMNSNLDASKNAVINAENQEISIGQFGIRGRTYIPATKTTPAHYDAHELWVTGNTIAFTDNNWQSAKMAMGLLSNGAYGVIGDILVGKILAGNQLTIESEKKDGTIALFKIDGTGVKIHNSNLDITNTKNKILLDPTVGIKIEAKVNEKWETRLFADSSGNLNINKLVATEGTFSGKITAASGKIGGWSINGNGLFQSNANGQYDSSLNHIFPSDIRLGQLTIIGNQATFSGKFKADQLEGQIVNDQIADGAVTNEKVGSLNAGKISAGSMSGDRIYGGTISWPGGSITGGGNTKIKADTNITFTCGTTDPFVLADNYVYIRGICEMSGQLFSSSNASFSGNVTAGSLTIGGASSFYCSGVVGGSGGQSGTVFVGGAYTAKQLNFVNGLLSSWSTP